MSLNISKIDNLQLNALEEISHEKIKDLEEEIKLLNRNN